MGERWGSSFTGTAASSLISPMDMNRATERRYLTVRHTSYYTAAKKLAEFTRHKMWRMRAGRSFIYVGSSIVRTFASFLSTLSFTVTCDDTVVLVPKDIIY
jgi:hypothetical protein